MIISGKELSKSLKEELKVRVAALDKEYGRTPNLVVILVGDDPGSVSYVTGKAKAATEVGIRNTTLRYAETITEAELLAVIEELNAKIAAFERSSAKISIAKEVGLPIDLADRISGSTDEEMKADATKLLAFIKPSHQRQEFQPEMPDTMSGVEKAFLAKNPGLVL